MKNKGKGVAIYSRKSRFTGKGDSVANQIEFCKKYVRANFGDEAADNVLIFEDEGFSGGNLNRPGFQSMMEAAKRGDFHAIVVYRLDRISRSVGDFIQLINELDRMSVEFFSINERFDTHIPTGRAMMLVSSVFSQLEREIIAERIRDNMMELAKTGRWLGGNTPTGYESESISNVTVDGKSRKACKLKLIPEEAEIVKTIFNLYTETDSLTATEAELLRRGIKTKWRNNYTRFTIKGILQNPVYMIAEEEAYRYLQEQQVCLCAQPEEFDGIHGIMAYNRTDQEKGRAAVFLPMTEWIVAIGKHPGLIPAKQWISVQNSLERNKSKAYRKPRTNEALLTGLLYCSCGGRMYPKLTRRETADGRLAYSYVCKLKERSRKSVCNQKNISGNALDAAVMEQIKLLDEDKSVFAAQLEKSKKYFTGELSQCQSQLEALRRDKNEIEKKINSLVDSLVELGDGIARTRVAKRIEELGQKSEDIDDQIRELEELNSRQESGRIEFGLLSRILAEFHNSVDEMTVEQKRAAVRMLVHKVIWDSTNAHVVLFGADEGEVEFPDLEGGDNPDTKTCWGVDSK